MAKKPISTALAAPVQGKLGTIEKEASGPDWSRARFMLEGIKMAVRLSLAGQICLGMELLDLKTQLGFIGSGRRANKTDNLSTLNRTWDQWTKSELGVSSKTADRFIDTYAAAKSRVKKLGGSKMLIGLLDTPPAKLGDEQRRVLETAVAKATDGETQASLLAELKLVKAPKSLTGGATSTSGTKPAEDTKTGEQLAFAFFRPVLKELESFRVHPDRTAMLFTLPVESDQENELTLTRMERDLEAALHEVREAKAAKSKPAAA